jgi:putative ABC transport system ATP-binding protein
VTISNQVQCRGICKDFGDGSQALRVLHDIDLTIDPGKLTMLVGPSGCGKTTLVSIIAGIMTPTKGTVSVFGTVVHTLSSQALSQFRLKYVGFIFQQYNLLPTLSAAQNAGIVLAAQGQSKEQATRAGANMLDTLGLKDHVHKLSSELSGGQQQRVAIARALLHRPRLIICDEPTAALDAKAGRQVMQLLKQTALSDSTSVIVVSHDDRVFDFADQMVYLEDGRISRKNQ